MERGCQRNDGLVNGWKVARDKYDDLKDKASPAEKKRMAMKTRRKSISHGAGAHRPFFYALPPLDLPRPFLTAFP